MVAGPRAFVAFRMPRSHPDPLYHPPLGNLVYGDMSDGSADDNSEPDYGFDNDVFGEEEDELAMYAIAGMGGGEMTSGTSWTCLMFSHGIFMETDIRVSTVQSLQHS